MTTASNTFIGYAEEVLGIARRLQSDGVGIYAQDYNSGGFGRWSIVAGMERERFRFEWDGRALGFTISETIRVNNLPEWRVLRTLNLQLPEALSAMETFLREKFRI